MRILGLDDGIASIGWALIETDEAHGRIVAAGARTFDAPKTDKERTPTNQIRRQKRLARRTLRRRRQRMQALRQLLFDHELLASASRGSLHQPCRDRWRLRAEGLERPLASDELAVVLGHIARHRGFWSNSKRDRGENAPPDDKKMLGAIAATQEKLAQWRTPGEMLALDPAFAERKRNRTGDYGRTMLRDELRREARSLFEAQRRLGNTLATAVLEAAYAPLAFDQLPLQD